MKQLVILSAFLFIQFITAQAAVIYVNAAASGANNGSSWNNAYTDLQDALAVANSGDEIWVVQGEYKPAFIDQSASFEVSSGVKLFGGFDGTETMRSQRNWFEHPTTLSGEVGFLALIIDNSFSVVKVENATEEVVVDGFIIRDANNTLNTGVNDAAVVINNSICRFSHCIFTENQSEQASAVLILGNSQVMLDNSLFHGNTATAGGTITQLPGTGIYSLGITHCTLADNVHTNASEEVVLQDFHWEIKNSVIWGNMNVTEQISSTLDLYPSLSNSVIQGISFAPLNVVSTSPAFSNPVYNDFRPSVGTSAEDLGSSAVTFSNRDLRGEPRTVGAEPDAGCYEYKGQRTILVDVINTSPNPNGDTWSTAYPHLMDALPDAVSGDKIWVANGTQFFPSTVGRDYHMIISGDIEIYGGFQGFETQFDERNLVTNLSVVSGRFGQFSDPEDDAYKIFYVAPGSNCVIDGLIIQSANANGTEEFHRKGAGVYMASNSETIIRNCTFQYLYALEGGAAVQGEGDALVENSMFRDNTDISFIQNLLHSSANMQVRGCFFRDNISLGSLIDFSGDQMVVNACTFYENQTDSYLLNMSDPGSSIEVKNVICSQSEVSDIDLADPAAAISFSHSILQGYSISEEQTGTKVYFEDPYFLDPAEDDFRLCWASIGFDNGDIGNVNWGNDINGNLRLATGGLDIGAVENNSPRPVLRVDDSATDDENGLTWEDAFTDLNQAIQASSCGTEIWIAEGVYVPDPSNRIISFNLTNKSISLLGGFGGFEFSKEDRDWNLYSTILSGNIGNTNIKTDNSYRIVSTGGDANILIDGLFIKDAYSEQGDVNGALFVSGGVRMTLSNVRIIGNEGFLASAIQSTCPNLTLINSLIAQNHSENGQTVYQGGEAHVRLINCTVSENTHGLTYTGEIGGISTASATIRNSIFYGNDNDSPLSAGFDVANSIVSGGYDGGVNVIDANPLFVNPAALNFRLTTSSPAVDSGDSSFVTSEFDIAREPRIQGSAVDLGCFEFADFCPGDLNGDLVVNTGDLNLMLSVYGCSANCNYDLNGDTVINFADLQTILAYYGTVCGDLE